MPTLVLVNSERLVAVVVTPLVALARLVLATLAGMEREQETLPLVVVVGQGLLETTVQALPAARAVLVRQIRSPARL